MNPLPTDPAAPTIMVTGARNWEDEATIAQALEAAWRDTGAHPQALLLSGACPTGSDAIAERIWAEHHLPIKLFPADWVTHKLAAGPIRNRAMLEEKPTMILAFPLGASKGTRGTMNMAKRAGLTLRVYEPNCHPGRAR